MPSITYKKSVEGFEISFIEAAAYCTGSIGERAGGASDAIQKGTSGYLCDGKIKFSFKNKFFYDNDNYKQLGKNALIFQKNFHWDKIIKKYIKLI